MSEGVETGVLPGMGDLPERTTPAPRNPPADESVARRGKRTTKKGKRQPAEVLPVARVAVDMSLPHLDRPFDYLVPTTLDVAAVPGCRVRVRFAGKLVDGFLLERAEQSDHEGRLAYLERVTSSEPVLTPEIADLAREIADRYAGTLADVLRLAIPPRHARVEAENPDAPSAAKAAKEEEDEEAGEQTSEETSEETGAKAAEASDAGEGAAITETTETADSKPEGARSTDGTESPPARSRAARPDAIPADAPEEPAHVRVTDGHGVTPSERPVTPSAPEGMAEGHPATPDDEAEVSDGPSQPSGGPLRPKGLPSESLHTAHRLPG